MYCTKCGTQIDNADDLHVCPVCGADLDNTDDTSAPFTMPQNKQLRQEASALLKKNFGFSILTQILLGLVQIGSLLLGTIFGPIFVGGAVNSSYAGFWLDVANDKCEGTKSTYRGFNNIKPAFIIYILIFLIKLLPLTLLIMFALNIFGGSFGSRIIWIIVLFFYGVIFLFFLAWVNSVSDYAFFKLNREKDIRPTDAVKYGIKLVNKNFGKILTLKLSFIGWWLLAIVLGFFIIYVAPYYKIALAKQYLALEKLNSSPNVKPAA